MKKIKNYFEPWFVDGGGHNDIEIDYRFRKKFYKKIKEYVQYIYKVNDKYT